MRQEKIILHDKAGFNAMRKAGALAAEVLDMITDHVDEGVTTGELDQICHDYILAHGATPAPLNYKGFPKSTCISLNHVVCHGIPGPKRLSRGDILNIDITVILDGWYGDSSRMYWVGTPSVKAQNLTRVTYECLMRAVDVVRPGATLGILATPSRVMRKQTGFRLCVILPVMGWGLCFIPPRLSCIMASREPVLCWKPG